MLDARCRVSAVTIPPRENSDWDHARTRRLALRTRHAEWCQSVITGRESDGFYYHRTDYAYEGMLALIQGENWKTIDRIGFQVRWGTEVLELTSEPVSATPNWIVYRYAHSQGHLTVRYQLLETPDHPISVLTASYAWEGSVPESGITLLLKPLFDLRHMFYYSDPESHRLESVDAQSLRVCNTRHLEISSDRPFHFHSERCVWDLSYRLGSGDREQVQGQVRFRREAFRGTALGYLNFALREPVTCMIAASCDSRLPQEAVAAVRAQHAALVRAEDEAYEAYARRFNEHSPEVVARVFVMARKYGMAGSVDLLPESGGWWFRTPCLRPVFAGLLHNHLTLTRLGHGAAMESVLKLALRYQDPETGRLPSRLPDHKADLAAWQQHGRLPGEFYHGADALLLMFTWLSEYLPHLRDDSLFEGCYQTFKRAFYSFQAPEARPEVPVLTETGLLLTQPAHSWIHGRRTLVVDGLEVTDLPLRVDREWQIDLIRQLQDAQYAREHYQSPTFYLPEINAQWVRCLEVGMSLADRHGDEPLMRQVRVVYDRAIANYKRIFWNSGVGFLYNLITKEGRPDPMVTSPGIEAVSLLGSRLFTRKELASVWATVESQLLVKREWKGRPAAFGVLAKDSSERIFYSDEQYHEAVCWPRETPHLLRILSELGERAVISELLATNLGHQMEEGVVFYANEILSLPEGDNPAPNLATGQDPVPVKNPMQWASLWCDPYLARA